MSHKTALVFHQELISGSWWYSLSGVKLFSLPYSGTRLLILAYYALVMLLRSDLHLELFLVWNQSQYTGPPWSIFLFLGGPELLVFCHSVHPSLRAHHGLIVRSLTYMRMKTLSSSASSQQLVTDTRAGHYSLILLNDAYFLVGLNSFLSSPPIFCLSILLSTIYSHLSSHLSTHTTLPFLPRYHRLPSYHHVYTHVPSHVSSCPSGHVRVPTHASLHWPHGDAHAPTHASPN